MGFRLFSEDLLIPPQGEAAVLNVANQSHVLRLQREPPNNLTLYHWSPGTGSRWANVNLEGMPGLNDVRILFTWAPHALQLAVIPVRQPEGTARVSAGVLSKRQFRLTRAHTIVQVGDHGIDILDPWVFHGESLFLGPTAIETWRSVLTGVEILLTGKSDAGYMFEVTRTNNVLVALTTGFETYCSKRFIEIETEGTKPDIEKLISSFGWRRKSETTESAQQQLEEAAKARSVSVVEQIVAVERHINFQSFDEAKKAYTKTYSLKFGEIGISGSEIDRLRTLLRYRHRIVHVSPMLSVLNLPFSPEIEPEHANDALAREAINVFSRFIDQLHSKTLELGMPVAKTQP
jgi:hypothetical protein